MVSHERIRVLIADDQELVRAGFAMVIDSQHDMQVVGSAADGGQATQMSATLHPDVVLMDVRMPGVNGIDATRAITEANGGRPDADNADSSTDNINSTDNKARATISASTDNIASTDDPHGGCAHITRVIILTTFDLDEYVMAAINAGASGFLLKDTEPETLLNSIRTVYQGNAIIAPTATKRLIEKMMEDGFTQGAQAGGGDTHATTPDGNESSSRQFTAQHPARYVDPELDSLTERELEVLVEIAHGLSNQEIADKLFISLPTVKTHVAHILAKINARDRVQAVVFAYENGLVEH